jgi:hypothetical protein
MKPKLIVLLLLAMLGLGLGARLYATCSCASSGPDYPSSQLSDGEYAVLDSTDCWDAICYEDTQQCDTEYQYGWNVYDSDDEYVTYFYTYQDYWCTAGGGN